MQRHLLGEIFQPSIINLSAKEDIFSYSYLYENEPSWAGTCRVLCSEADRGSDGDGGDCGSDDGGDGDDVM